MPTYTLNNIIYTFTIGNPSAFVSGSVVGITTANIPSTIDISSNIYNITSIGNAAFQGRTALTSVTIPNSVTSIDINGFQNCPNLISASLGNSMVSLGAYAFESCSNLTSISFPNTLTTLSGEAHFRSCVKLVSASLGTSLTSISQSMFDSCPLLASITIPSSVTSIGNYAFYQCFALASSVTIPNSVTSIGFQAFFQCTSLTSATIGSAVTSIGTQAFNGCSLLTTVYFLRTPLLATPGGGAFSRNPPISVGKYYANVTNSSVIAPFFTSISSMPFFTSMTPFTSPSHSAVVLISYANLVANGNEVVDNNPYVFLVNAVSTGSLSIGATQGTATPWNASTNKTIDPSNNAYWTPVGSGLINAFSVVIQDSLGGVSFPDVQVQVDVPRYPCFLEGTKILCFENNKEVYREIENLRKGDLVKTINNGYLPIHMIGTTSLYNPGNDYRVLNRLYKCSRENYPTLFEDLYITGCHSILVPRMTDDQWENTKAVNGDVFVTDNHFRLIACADEKAEPFNQDGFVNIYHIALKHRDIYMNYGIYANGLLVESCSERNLRCLSNMRMLGENTSALFQAVDNVLTRQLVDTY